MGSFTGGGGGIAMGFADGAEDAPPVDGSARATAGTEAKSARTSVSFRIDTQ
jgi:hypothetical protein